MSQNALLVIAHGSRKASSNDEVIAVVSKVKERLKENYFSVDAVFLELALPSIEDGIKSCVLKGVSTIVLLPYFLAVGRHVSSDIPEIIQSQQKLYPEVTFKLIHHLGSEEGIPTLLSDMALDELE